MNPAYKSFCGRKNLAASRILWLKENFDYELICVCIDSGQAEELDGLEERAKFCGASKLYIEDLNKEFVEDYIFPTMKAGAIYEGKYLLGTSFARPIIAKRIVEIALQEGAETRFELATSTLARWHSTTELLPHVPCARDSKEIGAGEGT